MNPKSAQTQHAVLDLIRNRWSPRHFSADPISEADMNTLLEAASWSFSAGNMQPWFYLYAHRGTEGFDKILACLDAGNQSWAKNAAVLMVTLAKKERDPGKPNNWAKHDLGAANMLLALQATSMGFFAHPMGGFNSAKVFETLDVDSTVYDTGPCIALGYPGDPGELEEPQREKEMAPRHRKHVSEISFRYI